MTPSPPIGFSLQGRPLPVALLLFADVAVRYFILVNAGAVAQGSDQFRGTLLLLYLVVNAIALFSAGRWLKRRWADKPLELGEIALPICFAIMPAFTLMTGLAAQAMFLGMHLVFGALPLVVGLGVLGARNASLPGRLRRLITMLVAQGAAFVPVLLILSMQDDIPLSHNGRSALLLGLVGLIALGSWAMGDGLRDRWASAPASRGDMLGCLLVVLALTALTTATQGAAAFSVVLTYLAAVGLPFTFGMGLFAKAGPLAPGRFRRLTTMILLLLAALMALTIIGILWHETPLSGTAWNIFALGCAAILALPMWAAGRRLRRRWAAAPARRAEILGSIAVVLGAALLIAGGNVSTTDAALIGLHIATNSLPFALGIGVFSQHVA